MSVRLLTHHQHEAYAESKINTFLEEELPHQLVSLLLSAYWNLAHMVHRFYEEKRHAIQSKKNVALIY
jgi:hypothetical protein